MESRKNQVQEAIKRLRAALDITQQQLAVELGKAVTTVARWETSRPPRGLMLAQLERFARTKGQEQIAATLRAALSREMNFTSENPELDAWSAGLSHILEHRDIPQVARIWDAIYPKIRRAVSIISRKNPETGAGGDALILTLWVAQYRGDAK